MKSIIGIWRLIKTSARNDAGEPMHPPYGEKPRGLVVFYPDKRMMSVLCDGRSELPADSRAPSALAQRFFSNVNAWPVRAPLEPRCSAARKPVNFFTPDL